MIFGAVINGSHIIKSSVPFGVRYRSRPYCVRDRLLRRRPPGTAAFRRHHLMQLSVIVHQRVYIRSPVQMMSIQTLRTLRSKKESIGYEYIYAE